MDVGHAWVFALPLLVLVWAATRAVAAARCLPGARAVWWAFALMTLFAAAASAAGLASGLTGSPLEAAYYLGAAASVAMVGATALLARRSLGMARLDGVLEALIFIVLGSAVSVYFVIVPGFESGDALLTGVFAVDLLALAFALGCAVGCRGEQTVSWAVVGGVAAACAGDGVVSAASSGQAAALIEVTALTWAMAGGAFGWAAMVAASPGPTAEARTGSWFTSRILLPFAAVVALPEIAIGLWFTTGLTTFSAAFFSSVFVVILLLVFVRQAYLLRDNRRAIARERSLSEEMARRNADLEALTGLATTMTQSLDEDSIVERGLRMLVVGARATGAALHVPGDAGPVLLGTSGDGAPGLGAELSPLDTGAEVQERGGALAIGLPLRARGSHMGAVTLSRPATDALGEGELARLEVLANQLCIAIQNARDYSDKLEQAIRDPLTGVYNRRYFYEALDKEIMRAQRYGSPVSLVLFDIDDFKSINDTLGHAKGDDALRRVTEIALGQIRDVDSFARVGGEEFALLLPETQRLDALLVADRLRAAVARRHILEGRRVTLSGGVVCCPHDGATTEELERQADSALYWAKRNGKNICALASEVTETARGGSTETLPTHLAALVSAIDSEPLHTRDHSENVAAYAVAIGNELGLAEGHVVKLRHAAFLHDIGKIAVPRETLAKPEPLSDAEWEQVRIHPAVGLSILAHAGLADEAEWVGQHHEQIDGRGYPRGLRDAEIALEARIILVADAFEAMTSDRPYRAGLPVTRAVEELRRCAGTQFDERAVSAIASLIDRDELAVLALRA